MDTTRAIMVRNEGTFDVDARNGIPYPRIFFSGAFDAVQGMADGFFAGGDDGRDPRCDTDPRQRLGDALDGRTLGIRPVDVHAPVAVDLGVDEPGGQHWQVGGGGTALAVNGPDRAAVVMHGQ